MALEKNKKDNTPKEKEVLSQGNQDELNEKLNKALARLEQLEAEKQQAPAPVQGGFDMAALEKVLTAVTRNNNASSNGKYSDQYQYVDEADIDPDDFIEEGHTFFCHQGGYCIVDDMRQGRPVQTPLSTVIMFDFLKSNMKGHGKEIEIDVLSTYVSYSKREVKWLQESSFYGWIIFDDIEMATSDSAKKVARISQFLTSIRSMEKKEMIKECRRRGIAMNAKTENMRLELATAMSEEQVTREKQESSNRAKNAIIEAQIFDQK